MKLKRTLFTTSLVVGGLLGTLTIFNKLTESMAGELGATMIGEERRYPWKYGDMYYEVKGERTAKPLLLIHGFGPGASSFEWRKNIDTLSTQYRVYVVDLLGFGLSDRPAIDYTAETYTDLIHDFIREVIGKPTTVVAHGAACAYVVADAYRNPQLFERLVLVAPHPAMLQEHFTNLLNTAWKFALRTPILGQFMYNLLTSRRAIHGYYDRQGYHNPGLITDDLVEYIFTSAHQPNSRFAIASFLSSNLELDVHEAFARLQMPVLAIWGREGSLVPTEASEAFKRVNKRIEVQIIDKCSRQPQDEQAPQFNRLISSLISAPVTQ